MLRRYMLPMLGLVLGGMGLSLTPGYSNNSNQSSYSYPQNVKPGVSDEYYESQQSREDATGREELVYRQATESEEIAYMDERDMDIHERANRKGNWNYKQNWRYDREAFYRGYTQEEAFDREHPDKIGGPGREADAEYLQMRRYYLEERNRQNVANQRNNGNRNGNSQNNSYRANNQTIGNQSGSYYQPAYPSGNMNANPNYHNSNYHPHYPTDYDPSGYPTGGYYYQYQ
jgi:hypothetical protein